MKNKALFLYIISTLACSFLGFIVGYLTNSTFAGMMTIFVCSIISVDQIQDIVEELNKNKIEKK